MDRRYHPKPLAITRDIGNEVNPHAKTIFTLLWNIAYTIKFGSQQTMTNEEIHLVIYFQNQ